MGGGVLSGAWLVRRVVRLCGWCALADGICSRGQVPQPPHNSEWNRKLSNANCTEGGGLRPGETCVAQCQKGFVPKIWGVPSEEFTCSAETNQMVGPAGSKFECVGQTPQQCNATPPCEVDGCEWLDACTAPGVMNGACEARCRPGYIVHAPHPKTVNYHCARDGTSWAWQVVDGGPPLRCLRKCSDYPPLDGQRWRTQGPNDRSCGFPPYTDESCKTKCAPGYELEPGADPMCSDDDRWVCPNERCCNCLKKCDLARKQGAHECIQCVQSIDSTGCGCVSAWKAMYCRTTNAKNVGWYTCSDGSWVPDDAADACKCVPIVCEAGSIVHGASKCESGHSTPTASICHIECLEGYEQRSGSGQYKCSVHGRWQPEPPANGLVCSATCENSLPVPHADPNGCRGQDGRELPIVGELCTGQCAKNYVESENVRYVCTDVGGRGQGQWKPQAPLQPDSGLKCIQLDRAKPCEADIPAKNLHFLDCNHTAPGVECVAACDNDFVPDGGDPHFVCDAAGKWVPRDFNQLECKSPALTCPEGQAPLVMGGRVACTLCNDNDTREACRKPAQISLVLLVLLSVGGTMCVLLTTWRFGMCPKFISHPRSRPDHQQISVLRQSFLGGSHKMAAARLAEKDVQARWLLAEKFRVVSDEEDDDDEINVELHAQLQPEPKQGRNTTSPGESGTRSKRRWAKSRSKADLTVMFTGDHVGELQPQTWQEHPLGIGTYGIVYKATWRGRDVAVKVMKLPDRGQLSGGSSEAEKMLKTKVQEVMNDFVTEVEVCCDLNHPNLTRLLGYAEQPRLMMMQELLVCAVDRALYVDLWKPSLEQLMKSALDVARGMAYLHSAFEMQSNSHTQPIIHRDLKTPNLLLASNPMVGDEVVMKISDFGLSRDKGMGATFSQTAAMTGCGSVLWMAPEILLGKKYNEKVDVFSYAMCMVELIDQKLPWTDIVVAAEVPHRVTKNDRPYRQLRSLINGTMVQTGLKDLVYQCWHPNPNRRPAFAEVKLELKRMRKLLRDGTDTALYEEGAERTVACGSKPGSPRLPSVPELEGAE